MYIVKAIIKKKDEYIPNNLVLLKHNIKTINSSTVNTKGTINCAYALSNGDWASCTLKFSKSSNLLIAAYTNSKI